MSRGSYGPITVGNFCKGKEGKDLSIQELIYVDGDEFIIEKVSSEKVDERFPIESTPCPIGLFCSDIK